MVVALIAAPGLTQDLAEELAAFLPATLRQRFPGFDWEIVVRVDALAGAVAGLGVDLVQLTRDRMLDEGWQLGVCLHRVALTALVSCADFGERGV